MACAIRAGRAPFLATFVAVPRRRTPGHAKANVLGRPVADLIGGLCVKTDLAGAAADRALRGSSRENDIVEFTGFRPLARQSYHGVIKRLSKRRA